MEDYIGILKKKYKLSNRAIADLCKCHPNSARNMVLGAYPENQSQIADRMKRLAKHLEAFRV
jgi:hypothetical protein